MGEVLELEQVLEIQESSLGWDYQGYNVRHSEYASVLTSILILVHLRD